MAPPAAVPDPPAHILVTPRVPMLTLMARIDAVVCHGGMGTIGEALANGVPLVVAPIRYDQPVLADQVVAAGAGLQVPFQTVTPYELRTAVTTVLTEASYRDSARHVRESFPADGGNVAAIALEKLATVHHGLAGIRHGTVSVHSGHAQGNGGRR